MACSGMKKTKQCLTLNDKLEILRIYDSTEGNLKVNELAKTLKISRSTLVTIISNRKAIEDAPESDRHRFRARNRRDNPYAGKSKYQLLDETLADWVKDIKSKGEPFNGVILRNKALEMAAEMGFENFTASNGWSDRFKKKYDFEYKTKPCYCFETSELGEATPVNTSYGTMNFLDRIATELDCNDSRTKFSSSDVEEKLMQWLNEAKNERIKINGVLVKEMALALAGVLGISNFTASSGWLNRFQKKYHLLKYKKCKNCQISKIQADDKKNEEFHTKEAFDDLKRSGSSEDSDDEAFFKKKRKVDKNDIPSTLVTKALSTRNTSKTSNERLELFTNLSNKLTKEEEYQQIKLRLDKMEIELEVLRLASELIKVKKLNLQLDIENSKMKLNLLNSS